MEQMLIRVLNMSLTAGITILGVICARVLLRRAPKIFSYGLWLAVLFRLLCPVSFSMEFSLPGLVNAPSAQRGEIVYIPEEIGLMAQPGVDLPGDNLTDAVNSSLPAATPENSMNPMQGILAVGVLLWLAGTAVMAGYALVSFGRLKRRLRGALREDAEGRVYCTDQVEMPFVCGLLRPRIYLPAALSGVEREQILLHERIHIRRGDPLWRALGYLALCIHWFNPLVWAAFFLSGRDMEMSCDEAVVRKMGNRMKKGYCALLLAMSCGRRIVPGLPLAFGEGQTGGRIRNLFHYNGVGKRAAAALGAVCALAVIVFLANPAGREKPPFTCYEIPLGDGALSWGMSREEIERALGEPDLVEESEGGVALTWDTQRATELGDCSQLTLYVGINNLTEPGARGGKDAPEAEGAATVDGAFDAENAAGEKFSAGLCGLMMTIEQTGREEMLEKISDFYGELSPQGGATQMEAQLRQGVPGYFNETHFCEDWRLSGLPREEYDRLAAVFRANKPDRPIDGEDLLMYVNIWGVENQEPCPCVVQLDVSMLGKLIYLQSPDGQDGADIDEGAITGDNIATKVTFEATVLGKEGNTLIVEPAQETLERKAGGSMRIDMEDLAEPDTATYVAGAQPGDRIKTGYLKESSDIVKGKIAVCEIVLIARPSEVSLIYDESPGMDSQPPHSYPEWNDSPDYQRR